MIKLEDYYFAEGSDAHWARFLSLHRTDPMSGQTLEGNQAPFEAILGQLSEDQRDILVVAVSIIGTSEAKSWLAGGPIEMLGGLSPTEVLSGDHIMMLRMRKYFLRYPV